MFSHGGAFVTLRGGGGRARGEGNVTVFVLNFSESILFKHLFDPLGTQISPSLCTCNSSSSPNKALQKNNNFVQHFFYHKWQKIVFRLKKIVNKSFVTFFGKKTICFQTFIRSTLNSKMSPSLGMHMQCVVAKQSVTKT